ncbi:Cbb3-type cytochrome c oxidase subunit FixP [Gammaproteobacteria bacterium]|nr:Cbb3-type cytochrome c oxidase subunit FixP [Gammaproteobacteria bacterium]
MSYDKQDEVETTGHVWDEDLQEYNNPLPRWWLWSFYATIIFALVYWVWFPTWPLPNGWTKGIATIKVDGKSRAWSTRTLLDSQLESSPESLRRKENLAKFAALSMDELADVSKDPQMTAFANAVGKSLFSDNCATCHQQGGGGVITLYPNLADDDWLWGGTVKQIYTTISNGRNGNMTPMATILSDPEITDLANYVLTLSGDLAESEGSIRGADLFVSNKATCFVCHGKDGKGNQALGAANLTDKIWTMVDMSLAKNDADKVALVKIQIEHGVVPGQRQMPSWKERLTDSEIRALAIYVQQLGGSIK